MKSCPSCHKTLPTGLKWKTLVAGQVPHPCPHCGEDFRLTYGSKQRIAYLNVILLLGFSILLGVVLWKEALALMTLIIYAVVIAVVLTLLPFQIDYEKTSEPDH